MPERPLLILAAPGSPERRELRNPGRGTSHYPSRGRQLERLSPRFSVLEQAFVRKGMRLRAAPEGEQPEETLVLETIGGVEGFIHAVRRTEGLEWLGEFDEEDIPPDDDFFAVNTSTGERKDRTLSGRLFLVMANHQAFNQMLSLWAMWQRDESLPYGLGRWKQVFSALRDVRAWGSKDRLEETGVIEDWKERLQHGEEVVPCEIELWFRNRTQVRDAARDRVGQAVDAAGGQVLRNLVIPEIRYHALLANLPVATIESLIGSGSQDIELVQCEQIQFFRASGQTTVVLGSEEHLDLAVPERELERESREPIVALLDGLPLQNHRLLAGRLVIDDPDGFEQGYEATDRRHGTAMASLILHGDLNSGEPSLSRPLYVRPILRADPRDWRNPKAETVPEAEMVLDLVHRAIRRLFEAEGNEPPAAPSVCIVNLSIGIRDRPFDNMLSPLARLLDWLSWKYHVLFVVSAGNHADPIQCALAGNGQMQTGTRIVQREIIRAVASDSRNRRLLSPAEAMNVLTIASSHDDESLDTDVPRAVVPYIDPGLPSPLNPQGLGYRRSIKPDILIPGGKVALLRSLRPDAPEVYHFYDGPRAPGQLVATPGPNPGDITNVRHSRGTSNSAALTSRFAAQIREVIDDLRRGPRGDAIDAIPDAVILKALVVHAACWGSSEQLVKEALAGARNSRKFRENLSRLLGYGVVEPTRSTECTPYRVTALGGGTLRDGQAQIHSIPLPPSISGIRAWRRLTLTLSWITPVNPEHRAWRRAHLWFDPPRDSLRVARTESDWQAVQRGTVQHEILEGEEAATFVDSDRLEIRVNCRADAGPLQEAVPYAIAGTIEVAQDLEVDIYAEISARVAAQVRVAPANQG